MPRIPEGRRAPANATSYVIPLQISPSLERTHAAKFGRGALGQVNSIRLLSAKTMDAARERGHGCMTALPCRVLPGHRPRGVRRRPSGSPQVCQPPCWHSANPNQVERWAWTRVFAPLLPFGTKSAGGEPGRCGRQGCLGRVRRSRECGCRAPRSRGLWSLAAGMKRSALVPGTASRPVRRARPAGQPHASFFSQSVAKRGRHGCLCCLVSCKQRAAPDGLRFAYALRDYGARGR